VREKCFCLDGNRRKRVFSCDCEPSSPVCSVMRCSLYPWAHPPNCSIFHCFTQQRHISRVRELPRRPARTQSGAVSTSGLQRASESRGSFFTHSNLGAGCGGNHGYPIASHGAQTIPSICALPSLASASAGSQRARFVYLEYYIWLSEAARSPGASGSWEIISKRAPKRVLLAGAHSLEKLPLAHTHLISS
jgi:hypothetical protein